MTVREYFFTCGDYLNELIHQVQAGRHVNEAWPDNDIHVIWARWLNISWFNSTFVP